MIDRPRIVFVINSIGTGGAERALDTILRFAGDRMERYEVHLVLLDKEPERRTLPAVTVRHCLDARGSLLVTIVRLDRLLRKLRPALVVSLLVRANIATAIVGPRHAGATVLCERMHLGSHLDGRYSGLRRRVLRLLPRLTYRRATRILAVSGGVRDDLVNGFGVPTRLLTTIGNGYDRATIRTAGTLLATVALPPAFVVAVGRLVRAKGFDLLIEAYRMADPSLPLMIVGEGPERAALEDQIAAAGLSRRIIITGFLDNPFAVMARAAYLVSASRNEGFPNAIAEAMALGRPVIATDCPSGPAELLGAAAGGPGSVVMAPYGLIVPDGDVPALASAMRRMDDPAVHVRYAAAASERIRAFDAATVTARYWSAFESCIAPVMRID